MEDSLRRLHSTFHGVFLLFFHHLFQAVWRHCRSDLVVGFWLIGIETMSGGIGEIGITLDDFQWWNMSPHGFHIFRDSAHWCVDAVTVVTDQRRIMSERIQ